MAGNTIGAKIVLDGEADYRKALKNINTEQKELRSEMKLASSTFADQQNSIEALTKKNEILGKQYEKQQEKVEIYSRAVADSTKKQEEAGSKVAELREALDKANTKMEDMADSSDESADALAEQQKIIDELKEKLSLAEDEYDKANRATSDWKTSLNNAKTELNKLSSEIESNQKYMEEAEQSSDGCAKSIDKYGKSAEQAGNKSDVFGEKGKDAINNLAGALASAGIVESIEDIADALSDCIEEYKSFETASAKIKTIADESQKNMTDINSELIAMSSKMITPAEQLADAVYNSISAGVDTANAVEFAGQATKLATGGFTDATTAVDILTTAINAYGLEVTDATKISDYLVTTQNLGKTTVAELASNMGKVIPVASAYNVEMDNLSSAYAIMTSNGIATAESTTYIKSMLNELGDSGSTVSKVLTEKSGKSFATLSKEGKSLGDVIAILGDAVNNDAGAFNELWSSSEAGIGALSILGSGAEEFNSVLEKMQDSSGATQEAFDTMASTTEKTEERMNTAIQNLKIAVGETLAPELDDLRDKGADAFEWATDFVKDHPEVVKAIATLTAVIGGIAGGVAIATGAMALFNAALAISNPITIAVGVIGGLITAFVTLTNKTDDAKRKQKEFIEEVEKNNDKLSENIEERKKNRDSQAAEISLIGKLKDELLSLNEKESLSTEEKRRMKLIVDELNEAMPDLNLSINEQTGCLEQTNEELDNYIDNMKKSLEVGFMREDLEEIARDLYEAEKDLAEVQKQYDESFEEGKRIQDEWTKAHEEGREALEKLNETLGEDANDAIERYIDTCLELEPTLNDSQKLVEELTAEYEEMSKKLDAAVDPVDEMTGAMKDANEVSETYKGKVYEVTQQVSADMQRLRQAYDEAYQTAKETIEGQVGLFDELSTKSDLSTQQMAQNLKSQTDTFTTYKDDLTAAAKLVEDGLMEEGLLGAIMDLGVNGAGYLHELVTAAEADTEQFSKLMEEWASMETAKIELTDTMADIKTGYSDQMDELLGLQEEKNELASKEATETGEEIQENVENALDEIVSNTSDSLNDMTKAVKEKSPEVKKASEELCSGAIDGANDILQISEDGVSVSFVSIGYSIPQGIAQGISEGQQLIADTLQAAIDNAINTIDLSGITAKINRELGDLY